MEYIIDKLPGSNGIAQSFQEGAALLKRYRECKVVFSYAREDWRFVEKVAQSLKLYFPTLAAFTVDNGSEKQPVPNVFCYTTQGQPYAWRKADPTESDTAYAERNEKLADTGYKQLLVQANVFVLFAYKAMVKWGPSDAAGSAKWQSGEVHAWSHLNTSRSGTAQYLVDFGGAHDSLRRRYSQWRPLEQSLWNFPNGAANTRSARICVDAYDVHSAHCVAERILRHLLFDQDPSSTVPIDPVFSYEKHIVQMYQELPEIVSEWYDCPDDPVHHERMLKLLAYLRRGVPLFWPSVSRQADFLHTQKNPLVDKESDPHNGSDIAIGSPRKGIDMLWPQDEPLVDSLPERSAEPDMVVAAALSKYHHRRGGCRSCMLQDGLAFPEAGPRQNIYVGDPQNVAIVVSGGIAPGINAVIDGIVRRQKQYFPNTKVLGVNHGFFGLKEWDETFIEELDAYETPVQATKGGSFLKTCRLKDFLPGRTERDSAIQQVIGKLEKNRIKILYVIGGDGTMRAAHYLAQACRQGGKHISVVAIPKTMDNDILWVWQSFGFATAVEKARETIEHLATEVDANPRICILQLFGSASGFVVSHAVLASPDDTCDFALIPEAEFSIDELARKLALKIVKERRSIPFGLVVMAESAIPSTASCKKYRTQVGLTEAENKALDAYLDYRSNHDDRFPDGQITSELRSAALKLVTEGLRKRLIEIFTKGEDRERLRSEASMGVLPKIYVEDEERFRVFTNEPRHLLRSVPPSFSDVIMGSRLGSLAVDNAMAGYTGFMISQWLTEFVMVPLELVALGRKHIPQDGIFWKSVLAKTGQGRLVKDAEQLREVGADTHADGK